MALSIPGEIATHTGDTAFGLAPGNQRAIMYIDSDAAADGTAKVSFHMPIGKTIPTGTKTIHMWVHAGGTTGDYDFDLTFLPVGEDEDPAASKGSVDETITETMDSGHNDSNFKLTTTFTQTIATNDIVLLDLTHDTSGTTVTGEFLWVLKIWMEIAD